MKVTPTGLAEVLLIEPRIFGDARGSFFANWNEREFERAGIRARFVQDNHSRSGRGGRRGLHYQIRQPHGHLIRVDAGEIFDAQPDIRRCYHNVGPRGGDVMHCGAPRGEVLARCREGLGVAVPDRIGSVVRSVRPDVLINAAAYTAVARAESEPEAAYAINAAAVAILAGEGKRAQTLLVHYSTDYVFDGTKDAPYTEEDRPNPLNAYGRSKLAGEQAIHDIGGAHLILPTSWVYSAPRKNFFLTIPRLLPDKKELRVVSDQIGAPTSARGLAH